MADVLDIHHHDPTYTASQYFPHNTPASINTPVQAFGGIDLTGEITAAAQSTYVNIFDWPLIAAMLSSADQDLPSNVSSPQHQQQQQPSRQQFNEMAAAAGYPNHHYSHENSIQQLQQPSPPFVEPSGNYIAVTTTTNTVTTPNFSYGFSSTTLPNTTQSIPLDNNGNLGTNYSSHNAYMGNSNHQQQQQQHHNNMISSYNFNLNQREIYQPPIPTSSSCHHHNKSVPSSNYVRHDVATSLPISIAPNLFMPPPFNNQANNGSTMMVPMFDQPTIFSKTTSVPTTISINSPAPESNNSTSPTKQTYSYSGPPKSYYSRLPLYDRPYKCDQCPQSFNRNHDLKRHKRIHLAVKPYPCPNCDKQFSRKDALKRHILVKGCNKSTSKSKSTSNSPISSKSIDGSDPIKTEPASDNGYGMSI